MAVKIGDTVRYLNAVGGGRVVRIENNMAYIDDDGFETPVPVRECVVVASTSDTHGQAKTAATSKPATSISKESTTPEPPKVRRPDVSEVPGGDTMNVVLGFEASDLKTLSQATFDTYIINDSNYYLYLSMATRPVDSRCWATRFAGIVEPNTQVFLCEITRDDLPSMDRIAVQYIAFKNDKDYALKQPASVELKLDTTKFYKLHCFRDNPYFDVPVLAFDIVRDDRPATQTVPDAEKLREAIASTPIHSKKEDRPMLSHTAKPSRQAEIIEVDLHADELLDSTAGLSNADILNLQLDRFSEVMDANLRHPGQKIVFIHGKGEGVLRQALMKELTHRYKGHDVQDASFREYGFGATQVTIRQQQPEHRNGRREKNDKRR